MISTIFIAFVIAISSYFVWSYIHEMSHVLMAKRLVGIKDYKLRLYPHRLDGGFWCWASTSYTPILPISKEDGAWISIAPRIPDVLAAVMFVLTGLAAPLFLGGGSWLALTLAIFWGAGLVDLFVGSLGISEFSDLRRAAKGFGRSPMLFRLAGIVTVVNSVAAAVILYFGG